ncbi:MAG: HPr family phosphocarrier protein [Gammaproteobacteria bacterium]|nr:HPr family phosphocarrier protein [Gammaproteobacteria bacterium]
MIEGQVTVVNALGLHARAAAKFVNLAKTFSSTVEVHAGDQSVDGKSIMGVMMLAAARGTELILRVGGPDDAEAFAALTELVADRFGEAE